MNTAQKFTTALGISLLLSGTGILTYDRYFFDLQMQNVAANGKPIGGDEIRVAKASLREAEEYLRQNTTDSAKDAMKIFNKILSSDYNRQINEQARYGLAVSLTKLGEFPVALDHLRKLKQDGVSEPAIAEKVDYHLGKLLLSINHVEEGKSLLEALLAKTKDDRLRSDIHTTIGNHDLKKERFKSASNNFSVALKYNPENLQAEIGRAAATKHSNRSLGYEYYDDYLLGNANLDLKEKSDIYSSLKNETYDRGIVAYRQGKYSSAIYYFKKSIHNYTDSHTKEKSLYWLGESYMAQGDGTNAQKTFSKVLENQDTSMDQAALIKKGILYFNRQQFEKAADQFERAIQEYPDGKFIDKAYEWRDETLEQLREKHQSSQEGDDENPDENSLLQEGIRKFNRQDFENALHRFDRVIRSASSRDAKEQAKRWRYETQEQIKEKKKLESLTSETR